MSTIFVQPKSDIPGQGILIAGANLIDDSVDDTFQTGISTTVWNKIITGIVVETAGVDGTTVDLIKTPGGSSITLESTSNYSSADVEFSYEIVSKFLADVPASKLTYASVELNTASQSISVARIITPGINGHQISVSYTVDGTIVSGANFVTNAGRGILRIIKHSNVVVGMHNDTVLFYDVRNSLPSPFIVKLISSTNGQEHGIKTKYKLYESNTGIVLGNAAVLDKTVETDDRIIGTIPDSTQAGDVDVYVFNHTGIVGSIVGGFTYPLILGQKLSSNSGVTGNIQSDSVLRD